ncbi:HAMP domain-containing histidine kinase [Alkalibacterium iburiense]|uniref:Signal transduction histidine-protein kinase ArlS n=1 Tax=Alkalibacterium iburiense TaxID=290589 RepID=A0ABN0X164_9LACT
MRTQAAIDTTNINKTKRISLRWKWTIGAAIALFLTYTIFSAILFITFQQIMIDDEQQAVRNVVYNITERLGQNYYDLSEDDVNSMLNQQDFYFTPEFPIIEESTNLRNRRMSSSQGSIVIRIFNSDGEPLYETVSLDSVDFVPRDTMQMEMIEDGPYGETLSAVSPINSFFNNQRIGYVQVINTLSSYHQLFQSILGAILLTGVIALLFSGIIGYIIAFSFLQPIRRLTEAMHIIEKEPESDERIDVGDGNDELTELANAYNAMLDRMQRNIEQQKQFVEDVSHELRTPVAVVEGHMKLLNRWGKDDPAILEESLSASLQEMERMKSLVQEMLDLSRAEQVEIHYKHERTVVKDIVTQTFNNFKLVHPDFTFILDDDIDDDTTINIYRNHLEQILIILLDNAVKYSTDRKEVHLSVSDNGMTIQIAIQDYGEGMTQEDTEKIFNRFYRVDKARSRHKGGNGLGLSIAKQLVEGYHGRITAESVLDHGSIFRVRFPKLTEEDETQ